MRMWNSLQPKLRGGTRWIRTFNTSSTLTRFIAYRCRKCSRLRTGLEQQMILEFRCQFRHAIGRCVYRAKVFSFAVVTHPILPGLQSAQFDFAFPVGRGEERVTHFVVFRDGISLGRVVAGHVKVPELSLG